MDITVYRVPHNGHLNLCTTYRGEYFKYTYIGYTVREAKQLFREYVQANAGTVGTR